MRRFSRPRVSITAVVVATALVAAALLAPVASGEGGRRAYADDPGPPSSAPKLIFIHHSCGENWLADGNGGLGTALMDNNYFVSDTNYGWGPDGIGDSTDIGHWWTWFRGPDSSTYTAALYAESGQNCSYSRRAADPGGANEIVMFKSCFPNSDVTGDPNAAVPPIGANPLKGGSGPLTVANCKGIYIDILEYFRSRPDRLFIAVTAPPMQSLTQPASDRAFNNWLVNDWLDGYPLNNVFVFDFYNVLTSNGGGPGVNDLDQEAGNHHRWWNGAVQHKTDGGSNVLQYPSGDDHPSAAGNRKATAEFAPLLNVAYNRFKGSSPGPTPPKPVPPTPSSRTAAHDSIGVTAPEKTWYLAEGCTDGGFETWVLVQNPGDAEALVQLTYQTGNGEVNGPQITVPPRSRESVNVGDTVKSYNVSTTVESEEPVIAERAMYLNNRTAAHDSVGVTAPGTTWYLAEGCTDGGFETWVLVQNPGDAEAHVQLKYQTDKGEVSGPGLTIPAHSRQSVNVAETVRTFKVSTMVTSDVDVICERAMYGNGRAWAHDSIGVTAAEKTWYLAEGCTDGGFETWVLVQNPGDAEANVRLTYQTGNGEVNGPQITVPPRSRESVNVGDTVKSYNVSTTVESEEPVIAERAMYLNNRTAAHDSVGVTAPGTTWYLAEGCTDGGFETWVLVQNPGDAEAHVQLTYQTDKGEVSGPGLTIPAHSRQSVNVAETVRTFKVSTMVTSDVDIICERAMYL